MKDITVAWSWMEGWRLEENTTAQQRQRQLGLRSSSDLINRGISDRRGKMEVSNGMMRMLRIENSDGRHHAVEECNNHGREGPWHKLSSMSFVLCEVVTFTFLFMQHGISSRKPEAVIFPKLCWCLSNVCHSLPSLMRGRSNAEGSCSCRQNGAANALVFFSVEKRFNH